MHADHDIYQAKLDSLKLFDNTRYPNTMSPLITYDLNSKTYTQLIIGFTKNNSLDVPLDF